jgi:predicted membrane protein
VETGRGNFFSPSSTFGTNILNFVNIFDPFKILDYCNSFVSILSVLNIMICLLLLLIDVLLDQNFYGFMAKIGYVFCLPIATFRYLQKRKNEEKQIKQISCKHESNDDHKHDINITINNESKPTAPSDIDGKYPSLKLNK